MNMPPVGPPAVLRNLYFLKVFRIVRLVHQDRLLVIAQVIVVEVIW